MAKRTVVVEHRIYPIRGVFRISRGAKTEVNAIVVRIAEQGLTGQGECIPYAHYGESVASVMGQIETAVEAIRDGLGLAELQALLPPGSARNAVDCALWDLRTKLTGIPVAHYAGLARPLQPVVTAFTLSLGRPQDVGAVAARHRHLPVLKLKLGGEGDLERVRAVREAAPKARLVADANESWKPEYLERFLPAMADLGVALLEQPLPADDDEALLGFDSPVPLAADESCRDLRSIEAIRRKYSVANIKLDKTGGLTEALALSRAARVAGLRVMVGCMVGSSLSMAPGLVVAQEADFIHLDGPMLLAADSSPSLPIAGGTIYPNASVWSV